MVLIFKGKYVDSLKSVYFVRYRKTFHFEVALSQVKLTFSVDVWQSLGGITNVLHIDLSATIIINLVDLEFVSFSGEKSSDSQT